MRLREHFTNAQDLLAYFDANARISKSYGSYRNWQTAQDGANILRTGSEQYNQEIDKLRSLIWESVPSLRNVWQLEYAGAFPSVPAYLAGEPASMWRLREQESDRAPIRVWIGTTSSAGVSRSQLITRGAALCAFAQAMAEVRPVYLTPYTACGNGWHDEEDCIISYDLQTSPLILSEIAAGLCEEAVIRSMMYSIAYTQNWNGGWAYKYDNEQHMREVLGADPEDLYLPSIHLYDPLLENPVKWVQDKIAHYTRERDE